MVYIQEILFRFFYLSLTTISIFLTSFFFKEYSLLFFINSLLNKKQLKDIAFLFSSPYELFEIYYKVCLLSTMLLVVPFILYQILQFLSQGLTKLEYKKAQQNFIGFIIWFFFFNFLIICFLLPFFWTEIELFNIETLYFSYVNIEYEPNLQQYIIFLYKNVIVLNFFFFLQYIYTYIVKNFTIFTYLKLKQYEKTVVFFIIATLFFLHSDIFQAFIFSLMLLLYYFIFSKFLKYYLLLKYKKQKQIITL